MAKLLPPWNALSTHIRQAAMKPYSKLRNPWHLYLWLEHLDQHVRVHSVQELMNRFDQLEKCCCSSSKHRHSENLSTRHKDYHLTLIAHGPQIQDASGALQMHQLCMYTNLYRRGGLPDRSHSFMLHDLNHLAVTLTEGSLCRGSCTMVIHGACTLGRRTYQRQSRNHHLGDHPMSSVPLVGRG